MRVILLVAVVLSGLFAGCSNEKQASTPSDLPARLDAALAINDVPTRNSALATVAEDAATWGEHEVVKKAIGEINDVSFKNSTAAGAASKLAGAKKRAEATEVANMINDVPLRNKVLSKLANGEPGG